MANFTFGLDPEFMLFRAGNYRSAIGVVPGSKEKRHYWNGHAFYYDNVMAEAAIKPAASKVEALANIGECLQKYVTLIGKHKLMAQAAQEYQESELQHPVAIEAACKQESCAYQCTSFSSQQDLFHNTNVRVAGGHIHLGASIAKDDIGRYNLVRMLDLFLGIPSVFLDHDKTSKTRKTLYGQAGRYREPPYGVEYRSMGNFWLTSPQLVDFVYDVCDFTIQFVANNKQEMFWHIDYDAIHNDENWANRNWKVSQAHICHGYNSQKLQDAVNNMSQAQARPFIEIVKDNWPGTIFDKFEILAAADPFDIYREWDI